ncbi:MAG: LLM class flavin-dependent oxidoreductase [Deltaproteobacteria bacterium]|nr:LLM class flavin-dependent oxidoreductase [Deltaproteobacteria bacterium]
MATKLKFGLLLPHFCEYGSAERCIEGSKKAEAYGFDSVWVRDHLVFEPHGMEGEDNTHIEGLLILAAVATVCKKLTLGTGTMISHRHPIHLAQSMAGLSTLCDSKIIMGLGLGTFPHEFEAAGHKKTTLQDRANIAKIRRRAKRFRFGTGAERRLPAAARRTTATAGCLDVFPRLLLIRWSSTSKSSASWRDGPWSPPARSPSPASIRTETSRSARLTSRV